MEFVNRKIKPEEDILVVDKPEDWTSHDVVAKVRGEIRGKYGEKKPKVGHGGSLDPFATGVLLILIGKAVKRFEEIKGWEKEYVLTVKLGEATDTGDRTGKIVEKQTVDKIDEQQLRQVLQSFVGEYEQAVPAYSAVKLKGRKLYQLARQGKPVLLPKRTVKIQKIELIDLQGETLKVRVKCGSGTYMRQLAVDIGAKLGLPAHAASLCRNRVGKFAIG